MGKRGCRGMCNSWVRTREADTPKPSEAPDYPGACRAVQALTGSGRTQPAPVPPQRNLKSDVFLSL